MATKRLLTGELIGYPWIQRPSVRRPFTFSNIFSSETAWPIKAKFYVEPPWEGGTKVCINGPGPGSALGFFFLSPPVSPI